MDAGAGTTPPLLAPNPSSVPRPAAPARVPGDPCLALMAGCGVGSPGKPSTPTDVPSRPRRLFPNRAEGQRNHMPCAAPIRRFSKCRSHCPRGPGNRVSGRSRQLSTNKTMAQNRKLQRRAHTMGTTVPQTLVPGLCVCVCACAHTVCVCSICVMHVACVWCVLCVVSALCTWRVCACCVYVVCVFCVVCSMRVCCVSCVLDVLCVFCVW